MQKKTNIVGVLVMNREKARFFRYEEKHLAEIEDFVADKPHLSDFHESKGGLGDKDNKLRENETETFTRNIAHTVYEQYKEQPFSSFIVIAPDKVPHELRKHLHTDLKNIEFPLDANIVHSTPFEIQKYLEKEFTL